jgi:hypothetical protein
MRFLLLPGGDIINDRVTPDVIHRISFRDLMTSLADDQTNLSLVVKLLGEVLMQKDVLLIRND